MQEQVFQFVISRIEEIHDELQKTDGAYALAVEKSRYLMECIHPIAESDRDITITARDCQNFHDYFQQQFDAAAIMQPALYRQGFRDCIDLLFILGILSRGSVTA